MNLYEFAILLCQSIRKGTTWFRRRNFQRRFLVGNSNGRIFQRWMCVGNEFFYVAFSNELFQKHTVASIFRTLGFPT